MIQSIEAVFGDGVFKPTESVSLPENQRVRLIVEMPPAMPLRDWLATALEFNRAMVAKYGILPDCTPEIRAERHRAE